MIRNPTMKPIRMDGLYSEYDHDGDPTLNIIVSSSSPLSLMPTHTQYNYYYGLVLHICGPHPDLAGYIVSIKISN